jgi:hypothetical protein
MAIYIRFLSRQNCDAGQQFRLKGGAMRYFIRSHTFIRCCSLLVLLLLVGTIMLSMSIQHHATQAAGSQVAANFPPYTVKGNTQAEQSAGGTAYVGSNDHYVYAFFAKTGVLRWRFLTGNIVHSSPAVGSSQGL